MQDKQGINIDFKDLKINNPTVTRIGNQGQVDTEIDFILTNVSQKILKYGKFVILDEFK